MIDTTEYKNMLTDLVKKQMVMLGPSVALGTARKVPGVIVGDDGTIVNITGDPGTVLQEVANAYMNLSGQIAQMTLKTILDKYPGIKQPGT